MSVDREYKIRISTVADGDPGKTADGLKGVGKSAEEAGEGVKLLEFHGLEFRRLVGELDRIMPGFGTALRAAFNPATLGLGVLVLLIEKVKQSLSDYNKKLDEIGEAAAKADFASSIEAAAEATRNAVAEQEKYLANLHEIEKGEHGVAVELNNQLQIIAAIEAARQQKAEADRTLALAKLKEQETSGALNPTQAALEKQRIEDQYTRDKRAAEERKFQEEQDARTAAAMEAATRQGELDKKQAAAAKALADANTQKTKDSKPPPDLDDQIRKAEAAYEAAQEKLKGLQYRLWTALTLGRSPETKANEAEADAAAARLDALNKLKRQADLASRRDLNPLETAADQARKDALANAKAVAAAEAARDQAQREHDRTSGDKSSADQSTTAADAANTRIELMNRARALQKTELSGGSLSKQEAAELLQLIRMLGEKFFEMGDNAVTKQQFQQEMQALRRLVESKK